MKRRLAFSLMLLLAAGVCSGEQITLEDMSFSAEAAGSTQVFIGESGFAITLPSGWKTLTPTRDATYWRKVPWTFPWLQGPEGDIRVRFEFHDKSFAEYFQGMDALWRQTASERHEVFKPAKRTPVQTASGIDGFRQEIANPANFVVYFFRNRQGKVFVFQCNPHGKNGAPLEKILMDKLQALPYVTRKKAGGA